MTRVLCIVWLSLLVVEQAYTYCLDGWTRYGGSCYVFGTDTRSFLDAESYCENYNATLVNIETAEEDKFIKSYLRDLKANHHWIGMTDEVIEDVWKHYPSEIRATFFDWAPSEPNNLKDGNCVSVAAPYFQWSDELCTHKLYPLCEMAIEAVLSPVG